MDHQNTRARARLDERLLWAARHGDEREIKAALGEGADPNAKDPDLGESAAALAISHGSPACLKALLEAGADVEALDCVGNGLAMRAAADENPEFLRLLIEGGANVEARGLMGQGCLATAAQCGRVQNMSLLVQAGARVDAKEGWGPLIAAVVPEQPEALEWLIRHGADVNRTNAQGETAAMRAARYGCVGALGALIRAGADLELKTHAGESALDLARGRSDGACQSLLEAALVKKALEASVASAPSRAICRM